MISGRLIARDDLDEVVQWSVSNKSPDEEHRRAALAITTEERERRFEAHTLNTAAWPVVRYPRSSPESVVESLAQSRRASELRPDSPAITKTLAVALYRRGDFDEVIATLARAEEQYASSGMGPQPEYRAFIAMSEFRLSRTDDAKASLRSARKLMEDPNHDSREEAKAFLQEAQTLMER